MILRTLPRVSPSFHNDYAQPPWHLYIVYRAYIWPSAMLKQWFWSSVVMPCIHAVELLKQTNKRVPSTSNRWMVRACESLVGGERAPRWSFIRWPVVSGIRLHRPPGYRWRPRIPGRNGPRPIAWIRRNEIRVSVQETGAAPRRFPANTK